LAKSLLIFKTQVIDVKQLGKARFGLIPILKYSQVNFTDA